MNISASHPPLVCHLQLYSNTLPRCAFWQDRGLLLCFPVLLLFFLFLRICHNECLVHFLSLLELVESCSISNTSSWSVPGFPAPVPVWLSNLETHNLKDLHSTCFFSRVFFFNSLCTWIKILQLPPVLAFWLFMYVFLNINIILQIQCLKILLWF